ncbi:AbrB family transcriptional regulator [Nocardioides sp. LHG3406-4]|uniref:AbrB family transcriptional regulator n=1 Tax=Nocardioides sp. LHG3406-4 TaxID=2804575 RepID=UPI003CE75DF0
MILHLVSTAGAALAGAGIATLLRLPAAPLLGAMAGVALLGLFSTMSWSIPSTGRWLVYCLVGWLLGQTITREALGVLRTAAVPILVTVGLFLLFGIVMALGLWRFTDLDGHTALLATAPGGIAQMGVFSAEARANVPVVLAIHLLRVTSVIVLMSVGLKLMGERP